MDVYTGPYVNPEPPPPPAVVEEPVLGENETDATVNATSSQKTKPEQQQQQQQQVVLKSQIKEFEANLTRVGEYLETLSKSYKQQMSDMRTRLTF